MQAHSATKVRGRPKGDTRGAREAIAEIRQYLKAQGMSLAELAIALGINPSSVSRAVNQKGIPRWTPSLTRIYRDALNPKRAQQKAPEDAIASTLRKLLTGPPPAAHAVRAIINDVQKLVEALSPGNTQPKRPKR
jgi:transcriptional regulator with XRE-family HTH domain